MKKIVIMFAVFVMLGLPIMSFNVQSLEFGDELITDWDDVASGLSNTTTGFIETKWVSGDGGPSDFMTSTDNDLSSPNSFYISSGTVSHTIGYWNLTQSYTYIGRFNFSYYANDFQANKVQFSFFNGTTEVIRFRFNGNQFEWYDVSTGYNVIGGNSNDIHLYLVVEHSGTNQFNIKLLNSGFGISSEDDLAGFSTEYSTFDSIRIDAYHGATTTNLYIDNFYINQNVQDGSDCRQLSSVTVRQNGVDGLRPVQANSFVDYHIIAKGDIGTEVYYAIFNDNDYVCHVNSFIMDSTTHHFNFTMYYDYAYGIGNFTFFVGDWWIIPLTGCGGNGWLEEYTVFDQLSTDLDFLYLDDLGLYAEFNMIDHEYFVIGDFVPIVYHLPDNVSCTNDVDCGYYYEIVLYQIDGGGIERNSFRTFGKNITYLDYGSLGKFDYSGTYELRVYNMTGEGFNTTRTDLEYVSNRVKVYIDDLDYSNAQGGYGDDDETTAFPVYVYWIAGIGITALITMLPLIMSAYITRKTRITHLQIPALVYVAFFYLGLITSVMIGLLSIVLPFVIFFGMITFFMVQWQYGKKGVEGE